ncbi:MAG TPA: DUF3097 domain-containing protein [Acidothermaceae bacterium]|nr:DUF3097 domain-containing protein [Acidothermaceae bacterium]
MNRYDHDVLAVPAKPARRRAETRVVEATPDLVVEDASGDFCGAVVECEKDVVRLEDRFGKVRAFPLTPGGFLLDGERVTLVRPQVARPTVASRTASGSIAVPGLRARVARSSRIYVEGKHDAELVERVWGDDLRIEGVVVEYLEGVDRLADIVRDFKPSSDRRLGVLVDHLVAGSKESRIAASVSSPHVLVVGHPYVDVWQAVRPKALGIDAWPVVERGVPWKEGVCEALGWPHDTAAGLAAAWRRILSAVDSYADLEPALLGRVEELIDFVTG